MYKDCVIYLVKDAERTHGVYETVDTNERMVLCAVRSVGLQENYMALNNGFQPDYTFKLTAAEEWDGERYVRYKGKLYRVIRSHETDDYGIELTVQRSDD